MSTTTLPAIAAGTYNVDVSHSEVGFVVRHLAVSKVRGRFHKFDAAITIAENVLDVVGVGHGRVASVSTNDAQRDGHLLSGDFFEQEKYPNLTFTSTAIRPKGSDYELVGNLTIKDVTKEVVVRARVRRRRDRPVGRHPPRLHRRDRDQPQGLRHGVQHGARLAAACSSARRSRSSSRSRR